DDNDGEPLQTLTITGIDISNFTDIAISGLFAAGNPNPPGSGGYDLADVFQLNYRVDGGAEQNGIWFNYEFLDDEINEPIANDTNFDGYGDGTRLTGAMQRFSSNLPIAAGTTLDLIIYVSMSGANEEVAFDSIQVTGTSAVPEPSTYAIFAGVIALAAVTIRRRR
ncbi:MAG: PEP-CTERM sorting domain-containing protein, partial [Puniceicoccales bacterium]